MPAAERKEQKRKSQRKSSSSSSIGDGEPRQPAAFVFHTCRRNGGGGRLRRLRSSFEMTEALPEWAAKRRSNSSGGGLITRTVRGANFTHWVEDLQPQSKGVGSRGARVEQKQSGIQSYSDDIPDWPLSNTIRCFYSLTAVLQFLARGTTRRHHDNDDRLREQGLPFGGTENSRVALTRRLRPKGHPNERFKKSKEPMDEWPLFLFPTLGVKGRKGERGREGGRQFVTPPPLSLP